MFPGLGTLVNVATVLVGTVLGVVVGHRLRQRTRDVVTDALGLVTLLIAGTAAMDVQADALVRAVGPTAPMLIVLGSLVTGGIIGSVLGIEDRLERFGGWLQRRLSRAGRSLPPTETATNPPTRPEPHRTAASAEDDRNTSHSRQLFIEGFVTASLVFCVGPLTVLGSLNDGLGNGADQLFLKAALDGFAAIAFAASFGWGVGASVLALVAVQGSLTVVGALLGDVLPDAHVAAVGATGGLMLVGVALRLLRIRQVPVGDLLPGLLVAPLVTALVIALR